MNRWMAAMLGILSIAGAATAQEPAVTADTVLERMCAFVRSQPALQVVAAVRMEVKGPRSAADEIAVSLDLQRPNLMRATQAGARFDARTMNTEDGLYIHLPNRRQYKTEEPQPNLADAVRAIAGSPMQSDVRFVAYLLEENALANLKSRMSNTVYFGVEDVAGAPCHHLRLEEEELGWDIWVDSGGAPLPRRIRPDLSKFMEARRDQIGATTTATMDIDLTWTHPAEFQKGHFFFEPPADTLAVREFQAVDPQHPQFDMLARPAPPVEAQTLEGAPVSLKPGAGEVSILDFWAIWCKPCHMLMPVLHEVAAEYEAQGVRLHSINVGDAAADITAFLNQKSFDTSHALLDPTHKVAGVYKLESFPLVVLVGKDGTIQTIRAGFGPGYADQLREDLDILVRGESIVTRPGK